ncbi:MAG: hypothetical protein ACOY0T_34545 [Myxococcota bacterium]
MADQIGFSRGWSSIGIALALAGAAFACSSSDGGSGEGNGGTAPIGIGKGGAATTVSQGGAPGGGNAGMTGTGSTGGTTSAITACSDGADNDGDGLIDGFDPECTGGSDNDEATYATGIPGDNRDPKWQDCFFDGNSGAGDDHCRYSTDCLTGKLPATDPDCIVSDACIKFCKPLTPNGCDCFGCCTLEMANGSTVDVTLTPTCSVATANDTSACPRCTKTTTCGNECGECELCPGKTLADLPATCSEVPTDGTPPPPPTQTCDNGEQVCGPDLPACQGTSSYCSFGCCIAVIR